ncbi:MAG: membrane protein insertion efficiency factor YidD [Clostridiales bacterium]|nr:membrane protein insertion efficiency factor YidD [Clostridiales bacterium]
MGEEERETGLYEATIDTSREASMRKAILILNDSLEANKPPLHRPNINPVRGLVKLLSVLVIFAFMLTLSMAFSVSWLYSAVFLLFFVIFRAKKTILWLILLYQKYAPEELRSACVFVPTCSDYMIQAIQKYGLLPGLIKGVDRLLRCHYPNGGEDNP